MPTATSIADEVRALKADNGLLKLANEQLANSYRQADQCATEREAQILSLLRQCEELAAALEDMLNGWKYIRATHGDLYGVGWDRAQQKAESVLQQIREGK